MRLSFSNRCVDSTITMSVNESVQRAHDELLASMPAGSKHAGCHLCPSGADEFMTQRAEEVEVAGETETKFSEEQHFALLESAVARETSALVAAKQELEAQVASLSAEKSSADEANTELQNRVDVLTVELEAANAATVQVQADFDAFKNDLAEKAEIEQRKADRVARVKAAREGFTDEWCQERAQRWAELSEDAFEALVEDYAAIPVVKAQETESTVLDDARETSAFKGGDSPSAATGVSTLAGLFSRVGLAPTGN